MPITNFAITDSAFVPHETYKCSRTTKEGRDISIRFTVLFEIESQDIILQIIYFDERTFRLPQIVVAFVRNNCKSRRGIDEDVRKKKRKKETISEYHCINDDGKITHAWLWV